MTFERYEVPIAYSMVALLDREPDQVASSFSAFCSCWMAFNNIYVMVADRYGHRSTVKEADGAPIYERIAHVEMVKIRRVSEKDQIDLAIREFSDDLKHRLIVHSSTSFFVHRTPHLRGRPIQRDDRGQTLNGVLNVGHSISATYPVWSPIDPLAYEEYFADSANSPRRDALTKQIVDLLYTVRNNAFHGGKLPDDATDLEVVANALPLLRMIVGSFLEQ